MIVVVVNRCFGISHLNKVTAMYLLLRNNALHFIADLMLKEEQSGNITLLATSKIVGLLKVSGGVSKRWNVVNKKPLEEKVDGVDDTDKA